MIQINAYSIGDLYSRVCNRSESALGDQTGARNGLEALPQQSHSATDVDRIKAAVANLPTGNALPILSEVLEALNALILAGEPKVIDLGAIPFSGSDEKVLQDVLGDGEVTAILDLMGESRVQETGVAGVWRVDHYDPQGQPQSRFIEVTFTPEILSTQLDDARRGRDRLAERLKERMVSPKTKGTSNAG